VLAVVKTTLPIIKDAKPLKKILSRIKSKTGTTKRGNQHIQTYAMTFCTSQE